MFCQKLSEELQKALPNCMVRIAGTKVVFDDDVLVGEAKISDLGNYAFIDQIFVKISKQGKGIGTSLLTALENACLSCGYLRIECRPTTGGELTGLQFCQSRGFSEMGNTGIWEKIV